MFAKSIIDSDAFLDMPLSTQALYFHLSMRADDDGFINNPQKIKRMIGASSDDLRLLTAKNFIIPFESGVVVIKHWKIHNYIQSDRYKETAYIEEKAMLEVKKNKAYTLTKTECIQDVSRMETQVRLGKDRLGKDSIDVYIAQSPAEQATEPEADVAAIILNDGTEWKPTKALFEEYKRLYPNVDVKQQFNVMRGWCISNPSKRKTKKGVTRFVNSWLSREQDKGYRNVSAQNNTKSRLGTFGNYKQTSKDEEWEELMDMQFKEING